VGGTLHDDHNRLLEAYFATYFMEELERCKYQALSSPRETINEILDAIVNFPMPECDPTLLAEGNAAQIRSGIVLRPIFTTTTGNLGLGDDILQPEDLVCVLFGGQKPFILRKVDDHYILVGECCVHGMMHGEAMEQLEAGEVEEEWFELH
jgi:hypothetical protein